MKITKVKDIPIFTRPAKYRINVSWDYLQEWIRSNSEDKNLYNVDLDPPFQRAHVWTEEQQIRYVEYILRGGFSSKEIYWNHPNWMESYEGSLVLVDGKQRLQAVLQYLNNKIPAFGAYLKETEPRFLRKLHPDFIICVNNLKTEQEVLQWYLDLNDGGTPHSTEEIEKVRKMLRDLEK